MSVSQIDQFLSVLCRGETFKGGESGIAMPDVICNHKSVGISVDLNTYEPHLLAGTMAHMIGHNLGMAHDNGRMFIAEEYCHVSDKPQQLNNNHEQSKRLLLFEASYVDVTRERQIQEYVL